MASADGSSFAAPTAATREGILFERMRMGSTMIKVTAGGVPGKKHVFVTPGNSHLKWEPSRRKSDNDFVDVAHIDHLLPGMSGARLSKYAKEHVVTGKFLEARAKFPLEAMTGWMEKMGGAHGGRKTWQKRWCVLQGTTLVYFASPADAEEKGHFSVTGANATPAEDGITFTLTWGDAAGAGMTTSPTAPPPAAGSSTEPAREFRADSPADRDRWIAAIKRAARLERARAGKSRPAKAASVGATDKGTLLTDDAVKAAAKAFADEGAISEDSLVFSVVLTDAAEGGKPSVAFICPSMREYEMWYAGLMAAAAQRRNLTPDKRIAAYSALLEEQGEDAMLHTLLGELLEGKGRADEAMNEYKAAAEAQPRLAIARKLYGRILLRHAHDAGSAVEHLEAASALLECDDIETQMLLAEARRTLKLHKPAVAAYQQASITDPSNVAAHIGAAESFQAAGDMPACEAEYATAINLLRKAGKTAPGAAAAAGKVVLDDELLRKHAGALTAIGKAADAAKLLKEADEMEVAHAGTHATKCAALSDAGRWREAVRHADIVLRARPDDVSAMLAAAGAYYGTEAERAVYNAARAGDAAASRTAARGDVAKNRSSKKSNGASAAGVDVDAISGVVEVEEEGESDEDGTSSRARRAGDDDDDSPDAGDGEDIVADGTTGPRRRASSVASAGDKRKPAGKAVYEDDGAGAAPSDMPVPDGAPAIGTLPVDALTGQQLLARAEELVVSALTKDAASAPANILCAKVFQRLAQVERAEVALIVAAGGYDGADGAWTPVDTSIPLDDQVAASGWSPSSRLQRVEAFLQYVTAAYVEAKYAEAPLLLAKLFRAAGRLDDAVSQAKTALERDPTNSDAAALVQRINKQKAGGDVDDDEADARRGSKAATRKKEADVGFTHDIDVARPVSGSKEERDAAYFAALKEKKKKEEEDKKKREDDKLRSMTPEERAEYDAAQKDKAKHESKKANMLKGQIGAYGGSARNALLARGGRGGRSTRGGME